MNTKMNGVDGFNPKYKNPASLACQVRAAIRIRDELPYQTMVKIFKKKIPYDPLKHKIYMLGFFEECSSNLIKVFMKEQDISREEIISMYELLPKFGEISWFGEAVRNGDF
ncbi:MAG: hypothetical protein J6N51_14485 [Selenomonas sp.]|nr:hypothetical protein [Selenomonas sp.]